MKKSTSLKVGTASLALGIALAANPVLAQGQPTEETLEETQASPPQGLIVVTGSRIASPTVESAAPLQIVDDQVIDDAGVTNVQELLLENPVFGTPALSRTNSNFLTSGTGVATVDLRDLGSDRTLVLLNGRRVVASLAGSATVDLNVIPTQFIQRIDILTGGASSLYGSDAVAGVVNFVYKDDFEGIEANAQYGLTEHGDDQRYQANVTVGANVADGDGNIMVHFGYSNEEGLPARNRRNTQVDDFSLFRFTLNPADFATEVNPFFSSFPPQGRFDLRGTGSTGDDWTFGPNGQLQSCFATNTATCTGGPLGQGFGPNGFNRQALRLLAVPVERYLFAAKGHYDITDSINLFFEGTFNKTSSSRQIEPFPLQSGGANGIYPGGGRMPIENYLPGTNTIVANPFVPAAMLAAAQDRDGDGLRDVGFTRRLVEFGDRVGSTERDFYRFVVGLEGDLFDDRFRWDASYNYGHVSENQVTGGQVNVPNFRDALAARLEIGDENGNGIPGEVICIDPEARANGCAPANIFGAGNISQAAVQYIQAQGTFQTGIKQHVVQGNISGSLFDLPGGPVGIAVGTEYRREDSFSDNDALTNAGLNAGNVLPDTRGAFDVIEGYAEVRLPILSDMAFFDLLEVGGAIRVADYSTVGTVTSYNITGTWQPVRDLRFRGTYARAVRAPNIGELFAGLSQTFPTGLTDPCLGIGPTGGGALGDNCRAAPGVSTNIANNGVFTATQSDLQGISGFNGGNPNLNEETADSWTLGAVLNPRSIHALRNLTITADYYNIEIEDVISGFPRQFSLDQCYREGNPTFCSLITRRPADTATNSAGSIQFINALQVNAAVLKTQGLDVTVNWSTSPGLLGNDRIAIRGAYTHVFQYDFFSLPDEDPDPADGEVGTAKDRFTANVSYMNDDFRIGFTGTYIGASTEDDQFCSAFGLDDGCFRQPAEFYLDAQATWFASDEFEFYFGVDNLLDNDPPILLSGTSFNNTGTDTAADVYDVFGRRYYAGARLRF